MITVIIFFLVGVLLEVRNDSDGLIAFTFLTLGFGTMFWLDADVTTVKTETPIVSLKDNSSTQGRLFLGSGSVDGTMMFTFYTQKGGAMSLRQIPCEEAVVKYTKGSPYVEKLDQKETDSFWNWFAEDDLKTLYILHVPEGSIQTNFNLDAE